MGRLLCLVVVVAAFFVVVPQVQAAGVCMAAYRTAARLCAKDPKCKKASAELLIKFAIRVRLCKKFRKMKQECRTAKFQARRACVGVKRDCKQHCRKTVKVGKGKRMKCRAACRRKKRSCTQAGRIEKRKCRHDARNTKEFDTCKDGRKLTRKAGAKFMVCAMKYFLPASMACAAAMPTGG